MRKNFIEEMKRKVWMNEYRSLKIIKEERLDGSRFLNERLEMIVSWEEFAMYMLISIISKWKPLDRII